jgi:hypothetical protein
MPVRTAHNEDFLPDTERIKLTTANELAIFAKGRISKA